MPETKKSISESRAEAASASEPVQKKAVSFPPAINSDAAQAIFSSRILSKEDPRRVENLFIYLLEFFDNRLEGDRPEFPPLQGRQHAELPPVRAVHRKNSEPRREDPVEGGGGAAPLDMPQHGDPDLGAGLAPEFAGQQFPDPPQLDVAVLVLVGRGLQNAAVLQPDPRVLRNDNQHKLPAAPVTTPQDSIQFIDL